MWQLEQSADPTVQTAACWRAFRSWQDKHAASSRPPSSATFPCGSWQSVQASSPNVSLKHRLNTMRWLGKRDAVRGLLKQSQSVKVVVLRWPPVTRAAHLRLREALEAAGIENRGARRQALCRRLGVLQAGAVTALAMNAHFAPRRSQPIGIVSGRVASEALRDLLPGECPSRGFPERF